MRTNFRCGAAVSGVLLISAFFAATPVHADTLLIDRIQGGADIQKPRRGMSMDAVAAQFGEPAEKMVPVGGNRPQHPPITRWIYEGFTVYFEHSHVVDTVLNKSSELEKGPKPAVE